MTAISPARIRAFQQRLAKIPPEKLAPFPWLRMLEVALAQAPNLDPVLKQDLASVCEFVRDDLQERAAMNDGELTMLRFFRALDPALQREWLDLLAAASGAAPPGRRSRSKTRRATKERAQ
jgi:hypothetical protein